MKHCNLFCFASNLWKYSFLLVSNCVSLQLPWGLANKCDVELNLQCSMLVCVVRHSPADHCHRSRAVRECASDCLYRLMRLPSGGQAVRWALALQITYYR